MAPLDRLKDVGVEVGLGWQVGLGQRLLHPLDLHQTQSPVLSWRRQPRNIRQPQCAYHHRRCIYYTDRLLPGSERRPQSPFIGGLRGPIKTLQMDGEGERESTKAETQRRH